MPFRNEPDLNSHLRTKDSHLLSGDRPPDAIVKFIALSEYRVMTIQKDRTTELLGLTATQQRDHLKAFCAGRIRAAFARLGLVILSTTNCPEFDGPEAENTLTAWLTDSLEAILRRTEESFPDQIQVHAAILRSLAGAEVQVREHMKPMEPAPPTPRTMSRAQHEEAMSQKDEALQSALATVAALQAKEEPHVVKRKAESQAEPAAQQLQKKLAAATAELAVSQAQVAQMLDRDAALLNDPGLVTGDWLDDMNASHEGEPPPRTSTPGSDPRGDSSSSHG
jgi:hypothetical protein